MNAYSAVSSYTACDNSLQIENSSAFSSGDDILIIQMKGAIVSQDNNKNFGHVLDYKNAGNYEFNTIASKTSDKIILKNKLSNSYDIPNGSVQVVRVAKYTNATITGLLTCPAWDGKTGGVLILSATDTITFSGTINVSGKGFRGGTMCMNKTKDCGSNLDYSYPVSSGRGAEKGESICEEDTSRNGGMGSWANGGGGGNKQNSGGGGGSNFTQGGKGGNQTSMCTILHNGGEGGVEMQYKHNKIFFGGGGGCSDNDDNIGYSRRGWRGNCNYPCPNDNIQWRLYRM